MTLPQTNIPEDLICQKEAAARVNISETYLNTLARAGKIPYYCKGLSSRRLFSKREIEKVFGAVKRVEGVAL